jgi:predicted DNA-binding ribbon-helix-helix protein
MYIWLQLREHAQSEVFMPLATSSIQKSVINDNSDIFRSTLISKNITVRGHRTSIRLEPEMWAALKDIAHRERTNIHNICSLIALRKQEETSLTAAIRVFLMLYYRAATTAEGHIRAGHGDFENMKRRARVTEDILIRVSAN